MLSDATAVTLTSDAAFAQALAEFDADALVVGADTVLADGRVVNKVGTRNAAPWTQRQSGKSPPATASTPTGRDYDGCSTWRSQNAGWRYRP